ncbi:MAG: hypothetical protein U0350_28675 [Caldilineaceae bacterium]
MPENRFNFNQCTLPLLDKTFGLRRALALPALTEWLEQGKQSVLSALDLSKLADLQELLLLNADNWNEQELSLHFIGPLLGMVKFTALYRYNLFAQRHIEAQVGDYLLAGEPDGLIASGYYEPEIPYFAFAEYKRQRDPNGDPAGQALAAMLVGQQLNGHQHPVYGCYVIGRDWYFMVLSDHHYAISYGHNALQSAELADILRILKALKTMIIALTAPVAEADAVG